MARLLKGLEIAEDNLIERLRQNIRRRTFIGIVCTKRARFLERKNQLDQVVYSLLGENSFLAVAFCRLSLEIKLHGCENATPRQNATPMESLAPFLQAQTHPILVEKLRVAQPVCCRAVPYL